MGRRVYQKKNGHEFWFPESGRETRRKVLQYTGAEQEQPSRNISVTC